MDWIGRVGFKVLARKIIRLLIQHFDLREFTGHWITEITFEDLLDKDSLLIYQHCGLHTLLALWENAPGLMLYTSEKSYFEAKKRYIRQNFNADDPNHSAKALALKLTVSESFVYDAIQTVGVKDDRQVDLYEK